MGLKIKGNQIRIDNRYTSFPPVINMNNFGASIMGTNFVLDLKIERTSFVCLFKRMLSWRKESGYFLIRDFGLGGNASF